MSAYQYQDYMELKRLFSGWIKSGVAMSREVKRLYWRELKMLERESRCRNTDNTRCMGNCRICNKQRDGAQLSLDQRIERGDLPQDSFSIETLLDTMELSSAINRLDYIEQKIVMLHFYGYTEREIAETINVCQKTVNNRMKIALAKLSTYLEDCR